MKGLKLFLTAGVFTVLGLTGVNALEVATETELKNCISDGGECVLKNNITASSITVDKVTAPFIIVDGKNVILDLNGKTLTAAVIATNKANLTIKDSGSDGLIETDGKNRKGVSARLGSKVTLESGSINSIKDCGVGVNEATFIMNGGKITAQEFGIIYHNNAKITINSGTIETKDNAAIGDNGNAGWGGNVVNVNGGNLISNIVSAGYISCGIYNSNDTL